MPLSLQIKDNSEVLMREAIRRMPDGEYSADGWIEDDGVIADKPYKFRATVVVRDDEIIIDYTGSDPQAAAEGSSGWMPAAPFRPSRTRRSLQHGIAFRAFRG